MTFSCWTEILRNVWVRGWMEQNKWRVIPGSHPSTGASVTWKNWNHPSNLTSYVLTKNKFNILTFPFLIYWLNLVVVVVVVVVVESNQQTSQLDLNYFDEEFTRENPRFSFTNPIDEDIFLGFSYDGRPELKALELRQSKSRISSTFSIITSHFLNVIFFCCTLWETLEVIRHLTNLILWFWNLVTVAHERRRRFSSHSSSSSTGSFITLIKKGILLNADTLLFSLSLSDHSLFKYFNFLYHIPFLTSKLNICFVFVLLIDRKRW
jgi:hypothetical protein